MQPARFMLPPPPAPLPEPVRRREGGAAGGGHRTAFEPVPITVQPPRQHTVTLDEAVGGGPGAGVVHAGGSGSVAVVWYRADLRVADHASLLAGVRAAAGDGGALLPLFVWVGECDFMGGCVLGDGTAAARDALADLAPQGGYAARREWMLSCLCRLDRQLRALGSRLFVLRVRAFEDVPKAVAVSAFREGGRAAACAPVRELTCGTRIALYTQDAAASVHASAVHATRCFDAVTDAVDTSVAELLATRGVCVRRAARV